MTEVNLFSRIHVIDRSDKFRSLTEIPSQKSLDQFFERINGLEKVKPDDCENWILIDHRKERFFGVPVILDVNKGHKYRFFCWIFDRQEGNSKENEFTSGVFPTEHLEQLEQARGGYPDWYRLTSEIRKNSSQLELFGLDFEAIKNLCIDSTEKSSNLEIDKGVTVSSKGLYIN